MGSIKPDLHLHSTASDGLLSPTDLVRRAAERGLRVMALTDHDTVDGIPEAQAEAHRLGIHLVEGIEFSCVWQGITLHILGLGIDSSSPVMRQATDTQASNRRERAQIIAQRLQKAGFPNAWEAITNEDPDRIPSRPDFARFLVEKGYVDSMAQAFDRYLGQGKIGDVKQFWPEMSVIVDWILGSGGIAVLAHPIKYKMTNSKLRRLVEDFKGCGGGGIEVAMPNVDSGRIGMLGELCLRYGLFASCGSDFHGPVRSWQDVGLFPRLPVSVTPIWDQWDFPELTDEAPPVYPSPPSSTL